jgi:hypothetical protein
MAEYIDRGSPVLIEVEIKKQAPFGSLALYDPANPPTIIVTSPSGATVAETVATKSATGQYYCILQTTVAFEKGVYHSEAVISDTDYDDIKIEANSFRLK